MNTAKYVTEITVKDPDTGNDVEMEVYKHENGGMFAIDSSYLDQNFEDGTNPTVPDLFSDDGTNVPLVELNGQGAVGSF